MYLKLFVISCLMFYSSSEHCTIKDESDATCAEITLTSAGMNREGASKYSEEANVDWSLYIKKIENAWKNFMPCSQSNCSCHTPVIKSDLIEFKTGITSQMIKAAEARGTKYQVINHKLFRTESCMFPARCAGVEHFILGIIDKLPNLEFVLNTRDWPQVSKFHSQPQPVFSFSKTSEYYDILYPAWSFWEGGPAIKLYPRGLGRWDKHRLTLNKVAQKLPWSHKVPVAFFRGSRTTEERDSLVLLSRERPDLVDASYTKNQAWRSNADTLNVPPADEVPLEGHCKYKYLFNFRGVAASFRFKHLFLCKSLVFHVGKDWIEFFYPAMKPWVHYIPVDSNVSKDEIQKLLQFAITHDDLAMKIAEEGYKFVSDHLRMTDVSCYWKKLLKRYAKLLLFQPLLDSSLIEIKSRT